MLNCIVCNSPNATKEVTGDFARFDCPRCGREPIRTAGASLHRGRSYRKGRGAVGQSGTAVAGPLGVVRSRGAAKNDAQEEAGASFYTAPKYSRSEIEASAG
jgi:predicted RNA-binding Zn-ribbon protein involved in translation (DUF1610 family)